MARFPRTEAEIVTLAQAMLSGLAGNAAVYPAPPIPVADLGASFGSYMTAKNAAISGPGSG